VFVRTILDIVFIWLQWRIYPYKAVIPEVFKCTRDPCPHTVECWPSRVKEKTIFFHYMYISAIITCLINVAEMCYIGPRRIFNAFACCVRTKDLNPGFEEESESNKTDESIGTWCWNNHLIRIRISKSRDLKIPVPGQPWFSVCGCRHKNWSNANHIIFEMQCGFTRLKSRFFPNIGSKIGILVKNQNFGQTSEFWSKIRILVKHRNFGQTSEFWYVILNFAPGSHESYIRDAGSAGGSEVYRASLNFPGIFWRTNYLTIQKLTYKLSGKICS